MLKNPPSGGSGTDAAIPKNLPATGTVMNTTVTGTGANQKKYVQVFIGYYKSTGTGTTSTTNPNGSATVVPSSPYKAPNPGQNFLYRQDTYAIVGTKVGGRFVVTGRKLHWEYGDPKTLYKYAPPQSGSTSENSGGGNGGGGSAGGASSSSDATTATANRPKTKLYCNPPLHSFAKGTDHFQYGNSKPSAARAKYRLGTITIPESVQGAQAELVKNKQLTKSWGFKFLYNPSAFGYSQNIDQSENALNYADYMNSTTPLLNAPSLSSYSLEAWLNRIPDMKKANQSKDYYSKDADIADLRQLWARGTEYDLDFLYRVMNGDPRKVPGWGVGNNMRADVGFIMQSYVVVKMGNGLYFQGYINSISVNHALLTDMMIPMLSSVSISITRLPDSILSFKA